MKEELSGVQLPIVVNMGINSGIASVGLKAVDAASGSRWRYGASGTVVNVAARVRECARDGSILLSAEAAARVQSDFTLEDIGEHTLKNVIKPVRIYRLVASCRP
jgi:class 3 adenylate cyclase